MPAPSQLVSHLWACVQAVPCLECLENLSLQSPQQTWLCVLAPPLGASKVLQGWECQVPSRLGAPWGQSGVESLGGKHSPELAGCAMLVAGRESMNE